MKKFKSPWYNCRQILQQQENIVLLHKPSNTQKPMLLGSTSSINAAIPCWGNVDEKPDTNFYLQFDPDQIINNSDIDKTISINQTICNTLGKNPCVSNDLTFAGNFRFLSIEDLQNGPLAHNSVPIGTKQDLEPSSRHGGAMDPVGNVKRLGIYNFNDQTYCSRQLKSLYAILTTDQGLYYLPFVSTKKQHRYFVFKNAECKELPSDYVISGNAIYYINKALEELMKNITVINGTQILKPTGIYVADHGNVLPSLVIHCGPENACDVTQKKIEWFVGTLVASLVLEGLAVALEFTLIENVYRVIDLVKQAVADVEIAPDLMINTDIAIDAERAKMIRGLAKLPELQRIQIALLGAGVASQSNLIPAYLGYYIQQIENCYPKCWYKDDVITSINGFSVHTPFERSKKYLMYGKPKYGDSNYISEMNGRNHIDSFTMKINNETFNTVSIKTQHGCEMTNGILSFSPQLIIQLLQDFTKEHPDFETTLIHGKTQWFAKNGTVDIGQYP